MRGEGFGSGIARSKESPLPKTSAIVAAARRLMTMKPPCPACGKTDWTWLCGLDWDKPRRRKMCSRCPDGGLDYAMLAPAVATSGSEAVPVPSVSAASGGQET